MDMVPTSLCTCPFGHQHPRLLHLHPSPSHLAISFSDAFLSTPIPRLRLPSRPPRPFVPQPPPSSLQISSVATTSSPPTIETNIPHPPGPGQAPNAPRRKRVGPRQVILRPPLDDTKLAEKFLQSPQLSLKSFPLLSSCLPPAALRPADQQWIDDNLLEVKEALGYPLDGMENPSESSPLFHLDTLLYLAFQHKDSERSKRAAYVRVGHSRLSFLGQYVLEMALAEFFLQRYPKETPACLRERIFGLTSKRVLPTWVKAASMDHIIFPNEEFDKLKSIIREPTVREVFWGLIGAVYLALGMGEVLRVLFEVFGMDPDAKSCQPKPRLGREDEDFVSPELDGKRFTWQDIALYKTPVDSLFAKPRLFRACVPPGMHRFRGNLWEIDSLPEVLQSLKYPRRLASDENPDVTLARTMELELGLQLCFLHPSMYKHDHPRFCFERLEFLGQKIQDVVLAERLLMKHLDGPGVWLQEKHRRILFNRLCGKYLREKRLQCHIMYSEDRKEVFDKSRRLRNIASTAVQQALHGVGYAVYGKAEVRRLMFEVFDFERLQPHI